MNPKIEHQPSTSFRQAVTGGVISSLAVMLVLIAVPRVAGDEPKAGFEWLPSSALSEEARAAQSQMRILPVVVTTTPKPTADAARFDRAYIIDLEKFKISDTGTQPAETSKGINAALQDAKTVGANRIVFPKGTYLISEDTPVILDHKDMIIDLNGATLRINPNGLLKYAIVKIVDGAENLRLTGGVLEGDRHMHDYKTVKGTHEWGTGLVVEGGRNLEVDHLTCTNLTGDGVSSGKGLSRNDGRNVNVKNLEQGGFTVGGAKVEDAKKTRTIAPYDMANFAGGFEFGYIHGYMGYPAVKDRNYQAYFFDQDMKFVVRKEFIQFKKNPIPATAKFMYLEFNQPTVGEAVPRIGFCGTISNLRAPVDVHFHHNHLIGNRRLGMAFCGGQRWILEENLFEGNGGTAPGFGIDFEDGWDLMQDIIFRNNRFKQNDRGDLVVCAGSEMVFDGNIFEKSAYAWGRTHNYTFKNNQFLGGGVGFRTRTGAATVADNHFENCTILISYEHKNKSSGIYTPPDVPAGTPAIQFEHNTLVNVGEVTGTYFKFRDSTISNTCFIAGKETSLIDLKDCVLTDCSIKYQATVSNVLVSIEHCTGRPQESGPGLARKKTGAP